MVLQKRNMRYPRLEIYPGAQATAMALRAGTAAELSVTADLASLPSEEATQGDGTGTGENADGDGDDDVAATSSV